MKKLIIIFCSIMLLFVHQTMAQLNYFTAEGSNYYDVRDAVPHSNVEFYSERGGGRLLKTATVNEQGNLLLQTDKDFHPAFVLNRTNQKIPGTGKVNYTGVQEFSFDNVQLKKNNGQNTISWQAAVNKDEVISFEVQKSIDGIHFKTINTQKAINTDNPIPYYITDKNEGACFYQIIITSTSKGNRYTSKIISTVDGLINLYPTAATDFINVAISSTQLNADYSIINQEGQIINKGKLNSMVNTINVANIAAGNYIFIINATTGKTSRKFIKL